MPKLQLYSTNWDMACIKLLLRSKYSKFYGSKYTREFVEVPSVLLENWCWLPDILKRLSQHFQSGEKILDDLVNNLARTKYFHRVLDPFQIAFAMFDWQSTFRLRRKMLER
jgi:Zn-dependent oligopeptidase